MNDTVEQLFINDASTVQAVARELRSMIKTVMPEAYESIYHGALSYSLSESAFERLVYLALERDYVRMGFNFGGYLPDPDHLLVGDGKRLRHVKVYTIKVAEQPALRMLVRAA